MADVVAFHGLGGSLSDFPPSISRLFSPARVGHARIRSTRNVFESALAEVGPLPLHPRVVVGHSAGGLLAFAYASMTSPPSPLVLIDPTHPLQFRRSAKQLEARIWAQHELEKCLLRSAARLCVLDPASRTAARRSANEARNAWHESRFVAAWGDQIVDRGAACTASVLLSEDAVRGDPIYGELWTRPDDLCDVRTVRGTGHYSILDHEDVADAVERALRSM